MPYVQVGQENSGAINIYYEDHGAGQPVVLIHGFPLSGASWEKQVPVLLEAGHRVITYDRRGFGDSSKPTTGYDYDTFAADLHALMETLDLRETTLVGFSMGTGEASRYLGTYGGARVRKAALLGPIPPFLLKTADNPEGLPQELFDGFQKTIRADRYTFFKGFFDNFFNTDKLGGSRISEAAVQANYQLAVKASAYATHACVSTWLTDFRKDVAQIAVPTLVVQGVEDRILPIAITGRRLKALIKDLTYAELADGPHAINWTHADEVNRALLDFLR
jgi:non-heme chloroperoxidase